MQPYSIFLALSLFNSHFLVCMDTEPRITPITLQLPPELQMHIAQEIVNVSATAPEAARDVKQFFQITKELSEHLKSESSMGAIARTMMKRFDVSEEIARNNLRKNEAVEQWYIQMNPQRKYYFEHLLGKMPPLGAELDEKEKLFYQKANLYSHDLVACVLQYMLGAEVGAIVPFNRADYLERVCKTAMGREDGASLLQILIFLGFDVNQLRNFEPFSHPQFLTSSRKTVLHRAVEKGGVSQAQMLINNGARFIISKQAIALKAGWQSGHLFTESGNPRSRLVCHDYLETPVGTGNVAMVRLLVNSGLVAWDDTASLPQDPLGMLLNIAINKGEMEMVKLLQVVGARHDLLSMVMQSKLDDIKQYLSKDESKKRNILYIAALCARPNVVDFVLKGWFASETYATIYNKQDEAEYSPMGVALKNLKNSHLACMHERYEAVTHIIDGADDIWIAVV